LGAPEYFKYVAASGLTEALICKKGIRRAADRFVNEIGLRHHLPGST
jgi:hypothetical protein